MPPVKRLYVEILTVRLMTESIIQLKPFPSDFCMFDIVALDIDSNTSSLLLSLKFLSAFK